MAVLPLSRDMVPLAVCLGGAPGSVVRIVVSGAGGKYLTVENEREDTGFAVAGQTSLCRGSPWWLGWRNDSLYPVDVIHHVGVDSRLPSSPPTLWLSKRDDPEENVSPVPSGCRESSPAVSATRVRHLSSWL